MDTHCIDHRHRENLRFQRADSRIAHAMQLTPDASRVA